MTPVTLTLTSRTDTYLLKKRQAKIIEYKTTMRARNITIHMGMKTTDHLKLCWKNQGNMDVNGCPILTPIGWEYKLAQCTVHAV